MFDWHCQRFLESSHTRVSMEVIVAIVGKLVALSPI